jgi:CheY-like chemotaxis protein
VLTNLVGNAVKFTQEGHIVIRVVGMASDDGMQDVHVAVEDTGIGIAEEHLEHVFGQFNQVEAEANRKFDGTGLGLSITRQLITLMGGEVWVDSELGRGSTFGFRLSLPIAEPGDRPLTSGMNLRRMLVVDDLQINRTILERQLATFGAQVISCRSAAEALEAIDRESGVDAVLTDHQMPGMNGLELARAIRARGFEMPILLLSSNPHEVTAEDAGAALTGILQKPLLRRDLYRRLEALGVPRDPTEAPAPGPDAAASTAPGRKMRVLAAEDNQTNRLVFDKMVKHLDIDLVFAVNGREAVGKYEEFRPDLVFMDISMPEMDGREATRAIRGIEAARGLRRTPIVAMTAHAMPGDSDGMIAAGMDHYLTKPLQKAQIIARIMEYCPAARGDGASEPAETAQG